MQLRMIWDLTMPMRFGERLHRTREWANLTAVRFVPKRLKYWITITEIGKATRTSKDIPATPLCEVLSNLEGAK